MFEGVRKVLVLVPCLLMVSVTGGQSSKTRVANFPLDSVDGVELVNAKAEVVSYRGRRAIHLSPLAGQENSDEATIAILKGSEFQDGTIEVDVAGAPRAGAGPDMRGFIGILFRVQSQGAQAEDFYLRPTNGRSDDQLRRNHSVQYESAPDFPWNRLRKESPGVYESYVDLDPGAWTAMKIVVAGSKARLYVNGADQPCLIVNDLKLGDSHGQIALWAHATTEGYFSNLRIRQQ
jgi:hypothetical protein